MNYIDRIETTAVRVPLEHQYRGSYYQMRNRCTIITRVYTSDGVIGEAYNADTDDEQAAIVAIINDELAKVVLGLEVDRTELIWERMLPCTFDQLRDRRLAMQAMACVDSAVWDAVGKIRDTPLWLLWGGYRHEIATIGIGGYYGTSEADLVSELEFFTHVHGLRGMKFKIGGLPPEQDAARLKLASSMVPDDFVFVVDANQGYTVDEALDFLRRIDDFVRLQWFEEPTRWHAGNSALRDVRLRGNVNVAAGQSEISGAAIRDMITSTAVDVVNFDASWGGGPSEWRRVAALAALFDVRLGHHEEAQLASHLLSSVPNGTFVEVFSPTRDPIFWQMLANRPAFEDGMLPLPEAPGFGWQLDADFIARYAVQD